MHADKTILGDFFGHSLFQVGWGAAGRTASASENGEVFKAGERLPRLFFSLVVSRAAPQLRERLKQAISFVVRLPFRRHFELIISTMLICFGHVVGEGLCFFGI